MIVCKPPLSWPQLELIHPTVRGPKLSTNVADDVALISSGFREHYLQLCNGTAPADSSYAWIACLKASGTVKRIVQDAAPDLAVHSRSTIGNFTHLTHQQLRLQAFILELFPSQIQQHAIVLAECLSSTHDDPNEVSLANRLSTGKASFTPGLSARACGIDELALADRIYMKLTAACLSGQDARFKNALDDFSRHYGAFREQIKTLFSLSDPFGLFGG